MGGDVVGTTQKIKGPISQITAAQDFTAAWADLGAGVEIDCRGYNKIRFYLTVDANDSTGLQMQVLLKETAAAAGEYPYKFQTVASGVVTQYNAVWNLDDADGYVEVSIDDLNGTVAYLQPQIKCAVVGASAGQIDACKYILSR